MFYILFLSIFYIGTEKHYIVCIGADIIYTVCIYTLYIIYTVCRKTAQNTDFAHTRSDKFTLNVLGRIRHLCSCL